MRRIVSGMLILSVVLGAVACSDEQFVPNLRTDAFKQDENPELLDILWVQDDRSPLFNAQNQVLAVADALFRRLDSASATYRMGLITGDMRFANGRLQPVGQQLTIDKLRGTPVSTRVDLFRQRLANIINLKTSGTYEGFRAALAALDGEFQPRNRVPLVVIFVSDSDDKSFETAGTDTDAVPWFQSELLARKASDSVRVYSLNYLALPPAATFAQRQALRCATFANADIDQPAPRIFFDEFFRIAEAFRDSTEQVTADLCGGAAAASLIDLDGLKLKVPKMEFPLSGRPTPGTLRVSLNLNGSPIAGPPWLYDEANNQLVFSSPPPDGASILATYLPR